MLANLAFHYQYNFCLGNFQAAEQAHRVACPSSNHNNGQARHKACDVPSAHSVLLGSGCLHILAPEVVCHFDVQIPWVFVVGAALEDALNHLALVHNESVFKVKDSLLPVCMP